MMYFWAGLVVIALYLNIVATVQLWRSPAYDTRQKTRQTVLVWLLPLVGSVWVLTFLSENAFIPGPGVRPRSWLLHLFALSFFLSQASGSDAHDSSSHDAGHDSGFIPLDGGGGEVGGGGDGGGGDGGGH